MFPKENKFFRRKTGMKKPPSSRLQAQPPATENNREFHTSLTDDVMKPKKSSAEPSFKADQETPRLSLQKIQKSPFSPLVKTILFIGVCLSVLVYFGVCYRVDSSPNYCRNVSRIAQWLSENVGQVTYSQVIILLSLISLTVITLAFTTPLLLKRSPLPINIISNPRIRTAARPVVSTITKVIRFIQRILHPFVEKLRSLIQTFIHASPRVKLRMVRIPLGILGIMAVLAWAVITFGSLFSPPKILYSFPGNQSLDAPLETKVEIVFDRGMRKDTVEKAFSIDPKVEGVLAWESDRKIIFTPAEKLARGGKYTITFKGMVLSRYFIPLLSGCTLSFETVGNLRVILAAPQTEAIEAKTPITVVFNRPVIALTTIDNEKEKWPAFQINPAVAGEGRWLGTSAYQFRPSEPYKRSTTYKVTVPSALSENEDDKLANEYFWEFSSERPHIDSIFPERDYVYASPETKIKATFSQPMNPSVLPEMFTVTNSDNMVTEGLYSVEDAVITFTSVKPLERLMKYHVTVKSGLQGSDGPNGMEADYAWDFSVADAPGILWSAPKDKATDVAEQYYVELCFKTPMDIDSFNKNVIIDPAPAQDPSVQNDYDKSCSQTPIRIGTYFGRSKEYSVLLKGDIKDQYGVSLGSDYSLTFSTAPYKPAVAIYPFGTYFGSFNQTIASRIVSQTINANETDYSFYKLTREQFLRLYRSRYVDSYPNNWQNWDTSGYETTRTWKEKYGAELNLPVQVVTKVEKENGSLFDSGMYFLDVRIPEGHHDNMVMIVSRATLTVKKSETQIFVWAINQSTGDVIPDMTIELTDSNGTVLAEGTTNSDGVFQKDVDLFEKGNLLVFGQKGDDLVVAADAWSEGIDRYDFGLPYHYDSNQYKEDYHQKEDYRMYITLDRAIYRPEQTVYFKGLIRKDNDAIYENLPVGTKVNVTITDSAGNSVFSQDPALNSFGSFSGEFAISKEATLGGYTIKVKYNGTSYTQLFNVEEYRKPEFSLTATPDKDGYADGETVSVKLSAAYYFGAPVSNAPVNWVVQTSDYTFQWEKDWRFEFGDPDSYWFSPWWYWKPGYGYGEKLTEGKGKTDFHGDLGIDIPLDLSKEKTGQRITVEASVNDINNQASSVSKDFIVHKGNYYVGLRPVSYGNSVGNTAEVEIVTVNKDGNEIGLKQVTLSFYKRVWESVREKNPDDGLFYYMNKSKDTLIKTQTIRTDPTGKATVSLLPEEGGTYKVTASIVDVTGNETISGCFLWVSGTHYSAPRENHDRIVVVTDKRDYSAGEKASVFVATPFPQVPSKTLLTVERGSVFTYKIVETSEQSNNFSVDILNRYSPNIFIGAVVVKKGSTVKDPAEFKIGYSEVKVTDKRQQIEVSIVTDKERYKPGETLKAEITTKNTLGEPVATELAVGMVDKAVWDLAVARIPDIYQVFYQPRNLGVETSQLLTISIDRINANMNLGSKGGSGAACFTGDTPILMSNGLYKPIREVAQGDIILTRESETSPKLVEAKVTKIAQHAVSDYMILNGELEVTAEHRLFVGGEWKIAGEVEPGDVLTREDGRPVAVYSIERIQRQTDVYNLEIESKRTYFAGGVYVHNDKGAEDSSRKYFPDTAYWNPTIVTDSQGKARVEIPLPDSLTTWRLSAVANSSEAAVGSGYTEFLVSRDLLIRPYLPRFLSVGDEAQLGVIISNTSGGAQNATIRIEATGLSIAENETKHQLLADNSQTKILWKTVALNSPEAVIKLSVNSGPLSDSVEIRIPILSYYTPEVVATAGEAKDSSQEKIVIPEDVDPALGSAVVSLFPSLASGGLGAIGYVQQYEYECNEQLTSKIISAVYFNKLMDAAGTDSLSGYSRKGLETTISAAIQTIQSRQHYDGGWSWWNWGESEKYLSAYIYTGLLEAKNNGYTVSDSVVQKAESYLRSLLSLSEKDVPLELQTYIISVLYAGGWNGAESYASRVFDRRFELSYRARLYLAMVMQQIPGMEGRGKQTLDEIIAVGKKTATATHWEEVKNNDYFFGNDNTLNAVMLEALTLFDKNNPLISETVRHLLTARHQNYWTTTIDTAAVIKALITELLAKGEQNLNEQAKIELNGTVIKETSFTGSDLTASDDTAMSMGDLSEQKENTLTISKSGEGRLYYNINMRYYLPFSEVKPMEQGIFMMREMVDSEGNILPSGSMAQNTEAWVRLTIVAPEKRNHVIIEDILPAGLEAVNESLVKTSILNEDRPDLKDENTRNLYFNRIEYHDEKTVLFADYIPTGVYEMTYRVRATTPGRYHQPPAQAYEMYLPDVSGHTDGGWFEVK